jgi:hypothetical protein
MAGRARLLYGPIYPWRAFRHGSPRPVTSCYALRVCDNSTPARAPWFLLYPLLPTRRLPFLLYIYALCLAPVTLLPSTSIRFSLACWTHLPRRLFNNPGGGFRAFQSGPITAARFSLACIQINTPILATERAANIAIEPLQLSAAALVPPPRPWSSPGLELPECKQVTTHTHHSIASDPPPPIWKLASVCLLAKTDIVRYTTPPVLPSPVHKSDKRRFTQDQAIQATFTHSP